MRQAVLLIWLTVLWLVLWRDLSLANVLSGLVVAGILMAVYPLAPASSHQHTLRPFWVLVFHAYFVWRLIVANVVVAREIVTPRDRIRSGIVAVPVTGCSDYVITIVANANSLTPGTLSLEVRRDPPTLYVHVMHLYDTDRVRRDISKLLELTVRAVGSPEALDHLDTGDSRRRWGLRTGRSALSHPTDQAAPPPKEPRP